MKARGAVPVALVALLVAAGCPRASAQEIPVEFLAKLADKEKLEVSAWRQATSLHEAALTGYWRRIEAKRSERRRKQAAGAPIVLADYLVRQPPVYSGPTLAPALAKRLAEAMPPKPPEPVPVVADFLRHAKEHYRFVPRRAAEREFKRAYAAEAVRAGLSREQVVGVYAFETGGQGTADMQAGINPTTREGRAITTALGYAQLLAANSIDELARHGSQFRARLLMMAGQRELAGERARELTAKAAAIGAMLKDVSAVPRSWVVHVGYARTTKGLAVHALNLDADIGPWLQVLKLKGLKEAAEKAGRPTLAPADIEIMNLAGPGSGLEMLKPLTRDVPTTNFFQRGGYDRNRVVHLRTAATLLLEIETRMNGFLKRPGAVEFAAVFEEQAKASQGAGKAQ